LNLLLALACPRSSISTFLTFGALNQFKLKSHFKQLSLQLFASLQSHTATELKLVFIIQFNALLQI